MQNWSKLAVKHKRYCKSAKAEFFGAKQSDFDWSRG